MGTINVSLIAKTDVPCAIMTSHAAKMCYNANVPQLGEQMDIENNLFKTGHHTTFEHCYYTFCIDGLSVGDVTFGFHLTHPFYNSDQRSGRFCIDMFSNPDYEGFKRYINEFWPEVIEEKVEKVLDYIKFGIAIYNSKKELAKTKCIELFSKERPFYPEKNKDTNCEKIANEQLRNCIPIIFPTGFDYTIDFISLVSMWQSAWNPVIREVTDKMKQLILENEPHLAFAFDETKRRKEDWAANISEIKKMQINIKTKPEVDNVNVFAPMDIFFLSDDKKHPIDMLHFTPESMSMGVNTVNYQVELSIATYGQDQRHRTVHRSTPMFTADFFLAPILRELGIESDVRFLMKMWQDLAMELPESLSIILLPYGSMVRYTKSADFNAWQHEGAKRLCWCAQQEIYEVARQLKVLNKTELILVPPCYKTTKCGEGKRYCGRDLSAKDFFPERNV